MGLFCGVEDKKENGDPSWKRSCTRDPFRALFSFARNCWIVNDSLFLSFLLVKNITIVYLSIFFLDVGGVEIVSITLFYLLLEKLLKTSSLISQFARQIERVMCGWLWGNGKTFS